MLVYPEESLDASIHSFCECHPEIWKVMLEMRRLFLHHQLFSIINNISSSISPAQCECNLLIHWLALRGGSYNIQKLIIWQNPKFTKMRKSFLLLTSWRSDFHHELLFLICIARKLRFFKVCLKWSIRKDTAV